MVKPVPQKAAPGAANRPAGQPDAPPKVEPLTYRALSPNDAVAFNAKIPFSTAPNPPARPFLGPEQGDSLARAVDCMAAAVLYEAGDDTVGQRAVAQVVINRVRHPAFPKSICGVVFEGAERPTGCQFTFTCDGALLRHRFSDAAWARARLVAVAALSGAVFKPVGHATHYHTNWVVPYWSGTLDKITAVGTHLFFRWSGWWGTPPAFTRQVSRDEPVIAQLAALSPAHQALPGSDPALAGLPLLPGNQRTPAPLADHPDNFIVSLGKDYPAEALPALAMASCGERAYCKFMSWADGKPAPDGLPLTTSEIGRMAFSYLRDKSRGFEKALWNCQFYQRPDPGQCMKLQLLAEPVTGLMAKRPELIGPKPELLAPKPELVQPATPAAPHP
ncbi:MAG: cell wall hydrolase [Sphingomonas sp.]|nr:cell wall hydrolase [Sphingomonas sp.]